MDLMASTTKNRASNRVKDLLNRLTVCERHADRTSPRNALTALVFAGALVGASPQGLPDAAAATTAAYVDPCGGLNVPSVTSLVLSFRSMAMRWLRSSRRILLRQPVPRLPLLRLRPLLHPSPKLPQPRH